MLAHDLSTLILGFGNPGRQDDGLGPAFVAALGACLPQHIVAEDPYQLTVEHAHDAIDYQQLIFVDACLPLESRSEAKQFYFDDVSALSEISFGSHSLSPAGVVELCKTLYGRTPKAYVLAIEGYEFDDFKEELSERARGNLASALAYLTEQLGLSTANAKQDSYA